MDMILINDNKLKVMLSPLDMETLSLTCDSINYDNTETRRAFWNILDEAKQKTGFDAASDRVFIQVYPSRGGGCEMYVTKLTQSDMLPEKKVSCRVRRPAFKPDPCRDIYRFDDISELLDACRRLRGMKYADESAVYFDENRRPFGYYLLLSHTSQDEKQRDGRLPGTYDFLAEYGLRYNPKHAAPYIKEYCKCICEKNAVEILADLA